MSYTSINDLRNEVKHQNELLAYSGSNVFFRVGERNGCKAVDLYFIDQHGATVCQNNIESGTSKECMNRLYSEASTNMNKRYYGAPITRKTAKTVLAKYIDFSKDPAEIRQSELILLHDWAKLTKYRKPVNFSRGYGFYIHLKNKVKV